MKNYFFFGLLCAIAFAATPSYIFAAELVDTQSKKSTIKKNKKNTVPTWIKYGVVPGVVIGLGAAVACSKYGSSSSLVTAGVGCSAAALSGTVFYTLAAPQSELAALAEQVAVIDAKVTDAQIIQNKIDAKVDGVQQTVQHIKCVQGEQGVQIHHIDDTMNHVEQVVSGIESRYQGLLQKNTMFQQNKKKSFKSMSTAAHDMNKNLKSMQKTFTQSTSHVGSSMQKRGFVLKGLSDNLAVLQQTLKINAFTHSTRRLPAPASQMPFGRGKREGWYDDSLPFNTTSLEPRDL